METREQEAARCMQTKGKEAARGMEKREKEAARGMETRMKSNVHTSNTSFQEPKTIYPYLESFLNFEDKGDARLQKEFFITSLEEAIYRHEWAHEEILSESKLFDFLKVFFSKKVLDRVCSTFQEAQNSNLGIRYTRRGILGSFAVGILSDLCTEARTIMQIVSPLPVSGKGEVETGGNVRGRSGGTGSKTGNNKQRTGRDGGRMHNSRQGERSEKEVGGAGNNEGGAGGNKGKGKSTEDPNGEDSGGELSKNQNEFFRPFFDIKVPFFLSPVKEEFNTAFQRTLTLRELSDDFASHPKFRKYQVGRELYYNPSEQNFQRSVILFHGTRYAQLTKFQDRGIDPEPRACEFSGGSAFYVTNSLKHAYEHVFHGHPGNSREMILHPNRNDVPNAVIVFGFILNLGVLHGKAAPKRGESAFKMYRFSAPDPAWKAFCLHNLAKGAPGKWREYDIIIGPVCLPFTDEDEDENCKGASACYIDRQIVTQVALMSLRAQRWLQGQLSFIFREVRTPGFTVQKKSHSQRH